MDHAAFVAVVQRLGRRDSDVDDLAESQRAFFQKVPKTVSFDDRHDEEEVTLVLAKIVDGDDGGVIHLGDQLGLCLEAQLGLRCQELGGDHLDRNFPVEDRILGTINDPHASATQFGDEFVPV